MAWFQREGFTRAYGWGTNPHRLSVVKIYFYRHDCLRSPDKSEDEKKQWQLFTEKFRSFELPTVYNKLRYSVRFIQAQCLLCFAFRSFENSLMNPEQWARCSKILDDVTCRSSELAIRSSSLRSRYRNMQPMRRSGKTRLTAKIC